MKHAFLLLTLSVFFAACAPENKNNDMAKANLVEKIASNHTRGSDAVEAIYKELLEHNTELQALEAQIEQVNHEKEEALQEYLQYDSKNKKYYESATQHIHAIQDSLLKNSIELLLKKSQYAYDTKKADLAATAAALEKQSVSLKDHSEAMKIILTMNLIEKYQAKQLPKHSDYKSIIDNYGRTIKTADSLLQAK